MSDFDDSPDLNPRQTLHHRLRKIEAASLRHAHRFIIRRWKNLEETRRHVVAWLLFVLALSAITFLQTLRTDAAYQVTGPSEGGTYTAGVIGAVNTLNPIFAGTQAELSASKLMFASLVKYDNTGDLVGDLAQTWSSDAEGKNYIVTLRPNIRWSDGMPITADDVVYTFGVIQNADTRSPLYSSWSNVSVQKIDAHTVRFILATRYAAFMNSLTVGILPQHTLGNLRPAALRSYQYNRDPGVTSGPFTFQDMRTLDDQNSHYLIDMAANPNYFAGAPKLDHFQLYTYANQDQLLRAFRSQEVAAVGGLDAPHLAQINPTNVTYTESPLYEGVYAFLNMDSPILHDIKVRDALQMATDRAKIIGLLGGRFQQVTGPLISGQLGYSPDLHEPGYNLDLAKQSLDNGGWVLNAKGQREKGGQLLRLQLVTASSGEYPIVAQELINEWSKLGIGVISSPVRPEDIQQNFIQSRGYDVLIYDVSLGRDPDVYAYWDSSQATAQGFNLSQYRSPRIDEELESARVTMNEQLRAAKYRIFTQQWLSEVPAIGLYRPSFSYVHTKSVTSFDPFTMTQPTDQYYNVLYWSAGQQELLPIL